MRGNEVANISFVSKSGLTFPNGVQFRREFNPSQYENRIICENCEKIGLPFVIVINPSDIDYQIALETCAKHAREHNDLCQKMEEIIIKKQPIYVYLEKKVLTDNRQPLVEKKPKLNRLLRPEGE